VAELCVFQAVWYLQLGTKFTFSKVFGRKPLFAAVGAAGMRLALPYSLFWWYWNFQIDYHKTARTIYFCRWKHLPVCHYFVIYVSPFASALEPDQYRWKKDILEHSDVNCLYMKPWGTWILVVLHDTNAFVLECLPISWWGGRCESGFVKWESANFVRWCVCAAGSLSLQRPLTWGNVSHNNLHFPWLFILTLVGCFVCKCESHDLFPNK